MPNVRDPASRLTDLVDRLEPRLRRRFVEAMFLIRSRLTLEVLVGYLESGRIDEATIVVERAIGSFAAALHDAVVASGSATASIVISRAVDVAFDFDATDPRFVAAARQAKLDLIREFSDEQRRAVRQAISDGVLRGANPREQARAIRGSIGLTQRQAAAVGNYRRLLEAGSTEALNRQLRDRRFDRTVLDAIDHNRRLSDGEVNRMVERYQERFLAYRAEVIARTEALRAVHSGNDAAYEQAFALGELGREQVQRSWQTAADERVRSIHKAMHGQPRLVGEAFVDGDGNRLLRPGDSSAPASTTVQCFLPSTVIGTSGIRRAMRRWYSGQVVQITTGSGRTLSVTANHPVFTLRGWVRADALSEGDYLIERALKHDLGLGLDVEVADRQAAIHEVFDSLAKVGMPMRVHRFNVNLHGERPDHDVDVVGANCELRHGVESLQVLGNFFFEAANILPRLLFGFGHNEEQGFRPFLSTRSVVSRLSQSKPLLARHALHADFVGLTSGALGQTKVSQARNHTGTASAYVSRDFQYGEPAAMHVGDLPEKRLPGVGPESDWRSEIGSLDLVSWDESKITKTRLNDVVRRFEHRSHPQDRDPFAVELGNSGKEMGSGLLPVRVSGITFQHYDGLVFNVETETGIIESNGIVSHNCRCSVSTRIAVDATGLDVLVQVYQMPEPVRLRA